MIKNCISACGDYVKDCFAKTEVNTHIVITYINMLLFMANDPYSH